MRVGSPQWKSSTASYSSRQETHREIILCCTVRQSTERSSSLIAAFFLPQGTSGIQHRSISAVNSDLHCSNSQPRGLALWKEIIKEEKRMYGNEKFEKTLQIILCLQGEGISSAPLRTTHFWVVLKSVLSVQYMASSL